MEMKKMIFTLASAIALFASCNSVKEPEYRDIKDIKITRDGKSWVINASYDDQAPLFSNIFILVTFDKTVTLGGGSNE